MKEELLPVIIEELEKTSKLKALYLKHLVKKYNSDTNTNRKFMIESSIWDFVYGILLSSLDRKTSYDLANTAVSISDLCYQIMKAERDGWYISMDGVTRRVARSDKFVCYITRTYGEGFKYDSSDCLDEAEVRRHDRFVAKYAFELSNISKMMDHKQEIISSNYALRNANVSREFVETLIDFLGLRRVGDSKEKSPYEKKEQ